MLILGILKLSALVVDRRSGPGRGKRQEDGHHGENVGAQFRRVGEMLQKRKDG
jgi:hypothetical protein